MFLAQETTPSCLLHRRVSCALKVAHGCIRCRVERFPVWCLAFGVRGLAFLVRGLVFGVWGLGFGVWGLGFGVSSSSATRKLNVAANFLSSG